ncbi:putative ankyrin repeat protein [Orchesella cincta]|uniref:Putative ankyrin repeat protein n=1 Tax=Orchesella cincta TaxID=48709 RepID=A0A1D2MSE7_ORCCI|nr:putative ankyrin repeat protein [Orchesella cincta]
MVRLYERIKSGTWREVSSPENFQFEGTPILHSISRIRFKDGDVSQLNDFVKFHVESGYDINQQTDDYIAQKRASLGFTALLAAVEQSNIVLAEILVKNGADVNIRDSSGFSACHWAVLVGDMACLQKLISLGAELKSTSKEQKGETVHPILHTAVDEGRTEMVFYLLDRGLVEVNEEAIYKNVLSELSFTRFPSRYNCIRTEPRVCQTLEVVDMSFTPLARAVRMRKIPIIDVLLKNQATLSDFSELHFCIIEGDTEVACILKERFPDEGLCNDKIGDNWALHCLHSIALQDELRLEKTKELIYDYIDAGWDVNSLSCSSTRKFVLPVPFIVDPVSFSGCSLLHLACMYKSLEIIKCLVEEGADVNIKAGAEGDTQLYPLQISILLEDWSSCIYLIANGADIHAVGCINAVPQSPPSDDVDDDNEIKLNSVELLLKLGYNGSVAALDAMLKKGIQWNGAKELHISIEGGNPSLIKKVLENVVQKITKDELTWTSQQVHGTVQVVPSLALLLVVSGGKETLDFDAMAVLMKLFAVHGYDFNATIKKSEASSESRVPLIFLILGIDFKHRSNLLKTLLEFERVQLQVRNTAGLTPVEWVLKKWNEQCLNDTYCWKTKDEGTYCSEIVKMLVTHGADVSELNIGADFKYHYGYKEMLQVLFCAGAKVHPEFFENPVCHSGYVAARPFHAEVGVLKKWVNEKNDRLKINLQFLASWRSTRYVKASKNVMQHWKP